MKNSDEAKTVSTYAKGVTLGLFLTIALMFALMFFVPQMAKTSSLIAILVAVQLLSSVGIEVGQKNATTDEEGRTWLQGFWLTAKLLAVVIIAVAHVAIW